MNRPSVCALLLVLSSGAFAQSAETAGDPAARKDTVSDGISHALELPAHRALLARIGRDDAQLAPFETDGCSGGLSEVWRLVSAQLPDFAAAHEVAPPWETCCVTHDRAYHDMAGATNAEASYGARIRADAALRSCVIETGEARKSQVAAHYAVDVATVERAYSAIAEGMYMAVRFGGGPCSGLPWRWGYGWPDCSILQLEITE